MKAMLDSCAWDRLVGIPEADALMELVKDGWIELMDYSELKNEYPTLEQNAKTHKIIKEFEPFINQKPTVNKDDKIREFVAGNRNSKRANDFILAATANSYVYLLVTGDERHFKKLLQKPNKSESKVITVNCDTFIEIIREIYNDCGATIINNAGGTDVTAMAGLGRPEAPLGRIEVRGPEEDKLKEKSSRELLEYIGRINKNNSDD